MRFDPVLCTCVALLFGALGNVAPLGVVACAAGALLFMARHVRRAAVGCVALALGVSWLRAGWVLQAFEVEHASATAFIDGPQRCALAGTVATSPGVHEGTLDFVADADELDCDGRMRSTPTRVRLYGGPHTLGRGDRFRAVAQLAAVSPLENLDLPDPRPRVARLGAVLSGSVLALEREAPAFGLGHFIDRARAGVRARIDATFVASVRPMARALVLGDGDLEPEDNDAFKTSGLSHLLAVSGTHLVFAVLTLVKALEAVLRRWVWLASRTDVGRYSAALGVLLAPLYADFAGGSGSAWRAALFLIALLGVRAAGKHVFVSRALAASLAAAWLVDPLVAFDYSFLLSLAATCGLIVGSPLARTVSETEPFKALRNVLDVTLATLSATLPCLPILLLLSPGLTLASLAANCLAAPFGETVALPLCLVHALSAAFPPLERGLAWAGSGALFLVKRLAHASASVDWLYIEIPPPNEAQITALALALMGSLALGGRPWFGTAPEPSMQRAHALRRLRTYGGGVLLAALGVAEMVARRQGAPSGALRVTALDVGQGDATLIDLPDGRLFLIDAGGIVGSPVDTGERSVLATLRARRRKRLDVVVLSHPHPDHFLGLLSVARKVPIGELWDTGQGEEHGAGPVYRELLATLRKRGVPIRRPAELCAQNPAHENYTLEVLAPCPRYHESHGANDNSLVLRIAFGEHAALFTGDIEHFGEERLLAEHPNQLRATFLKVAHHGSRTSTSPEFLRAVSPELATLSCDARNRFGHPHAPTLATLAAQHVLALRLDQTGAVEWETDGERSAWRSFRR